MVTRQKKISLNLALLQFDQISSIVSGNGLLRYRRPDTGRKLRRFVSVTRKMTQWGLLHHKLESGPDLVIIAVHSVYSRRDKNIVHGNERSRSPNRNVRGPTDTDSVEKWNPLRGSNLISIWLIDGGGGLLRWRRERESSGEVGVGIIEAGISRQHRHVDVAEVGPAGNGGGLQSAFRGTRRRDDGDSTSAPPQVSAIRYVAFRHGPHHSQSFISGAYVPKLPLPLLGLFPICPFFTIALQFTKFMNYFNFFWSIY